MIEEGADETISKHNSGIVIFAQNNQYAVSSGAIISFFGFSCEANGAADYGWSRVRTEQTLSYCGFVKAL